MLRHDLVLYNLNLASGFVFNVFLQVIERFDYRTPDGRCFYLRCRCALPYERAKEGLSVGGIDRDQIHTYGAIVVSYPPAEVTMDGTMGHKGCHCADGCPL